MRRWRRLAAAAGVSFAIGLVLSVAVAWGLCLWPTRDFGHTFQLQASDRPEGESPSYPVYSWCNTSSRGFRYIAIWENRGHAAINHLAAGRMREQIQAGLNHPIAVQPYIVPEWPRWLPDVPDDGGGYSEWGARAAGWPLLCLTSRSAATSGGARRTWWTVRVFPAPALGAAQALSSAGRDPDRGTVPLRPLPGLAANALLLGAPVFAALVAPAAVRRALRQRRGQCEACGYDRRGLDAGLPCPECGSGAAQ